MTYFEWAVLSFLFLIFSNLNHLAKLPTQLNFFERKLNDKLQKLIFLSARGDQEAVERLRETIQEWSDSEMSHVRNSQREAEPELLRPILIGGLFVVAIPLGLVLYPYSMPFLNWFIEKF